MRYPLRSLVGVASAAVLGGALLVGSGLAATTGAARTPVHRSSDQASARFIASARAALVSYLRTSHPQLELARPGRQIGSTTALDSYNWSGYEDTSTTKGSFTKVSGQWTTPAVKCSPEDQITSDWVGIDGANDNTVEQDGTISWCFEDKAVYFTWYEMYPAGTVEVGNSLKVGDKITATVSRSGTNYTLSLTDATHTANSFTEKKSCAASTCFDESAEWISERSAFSVGLAPLADYGKWSLSNASETAGGTTGTISSYPHNASLTMIDATASYKLGSVSALTGGKSFTTTWDDSW